MAFNYISAAEAASLIKHGYNIGLSGFTPAGTAKAVTAELAKIAEAEHAKGNPFQVGILQELQPATPATVSSHASKPSATVLLTQPTPISVKR